MLTATMGSAGLGRQLAIDVRPPDIKYFVLAAPQLSYTAKKYSLSQKWLLNYKKAGFF